MNTPAGIGCFKGCDNPVIGQCQGFKESCGSFYCAQHSHEKLCEDCNFKKVQEPYILATIQEYTELAYGFERRRFGCGLFIVFAGLLGGLIGIGAAELYKLVADVRSGDEAPIGIIVGLFVAFLLYLRRLKVMKDLNNEIETASLEKPHFAEFYKEWRKEQSINNISTAWNIVAASAAVAESLEKDSTRRAIREAAKK